MEKRKLKPWMAVLFVLAFGADIFVLSRFLAGWFGIWGTLLHEIILALLAVGLAAAFGADLKKVFPFHRPEAVKAAGTLILWLGTFLAAMAVTMFITYFFPQKVIEANQGVENIILSGTVAFSMFLIAFTPAVCEEMAFRGGLLSCFRNTKNKWVGILIVAVVFGIFHGSIWRCIPTAILGTALGYLLVETENMFYNMLFHFVNNAVPVLLLGLTELLTYKEAADPDMAQAVMADHLPLLSVAVYVIAACGAPFLIYIGNYLLHRGMPGYDKGLFPREKKKVFAVLLILTCYIFAMGIFLFAGSFNAAAKYLISN